MLHNNQLTSDLEPLRGCTALRELCLAMNQLTGGLEALRGFIHGAAEAPTRAESSDPHGRREGPLPEGSVAAITADSESADESSNLSGSLTQ